MEALEPTPKLPQVKKIPSAPAVLAGAGARLFTSAPGMVACARTHARQGPAAVAAPERHPGPAQMNVLKRQDTWSLGSSRGRVRRSPFKYISSIFNRPPKH